MFEDTKGVIRTRKSKDRQYIDRQKKRQKDRQYNDQQKKRQKDRQYNGQEGKKPKGQTTTYTALLDI
jgi:hypothetical protein